MEIELSGDEALVLFDFLARFRETDRLEFEHVAEFIALNKISATLEESLVEPFDPGYKILLQVARERVAIGWDPPDDYPGPKAAREG